MSEWKIIDVGATFPTIRFVPEYKEDPVNPAHYEVRYGLWVSTEMKGDRQVEDLEVTVRVPTGQSDAPYTEVARSGSEQLTAVLRAMADHIDELVAEAEKRDRS